MSEPREPTPHQLRRRRLVASYLGRELTQLEGVLLDSMGQVAAAAIEAKMRDPEAAAAARQLRAELGEAADTVVGQVVVAGVRRWLRGLDGG